MEPIVSIIIVNFCGKQLLETCLKSISNTSFKNYEIIVVDNNSNDGSVEFVKAHYPHIQVITLNKNYGFAAPNNIASKVAIGKYLVFLNNDTIVTPNWLSELLNAMKKDKTIVIGQSLLIQPNGKVDSSGDFIDDIGRAYSNHNVPKEIQNILSARAACMMVRKDAFLDLEGFDESYFASFEDVELGWKAWLWGYKVVIVPSSVVYHTVGQTIQQISKTIAFHGTKNNIVLRLTNFDFYDSIKSILLMGIIILTKKIFGISLIENMDQRFKIPDLRTLIKACFWILKNTKNISKKRKKLKSRKVRTNNELRKMGLITKFTW